MKTSFMKIFTRVSPTAPPSSKDYLLELLGEQEVFSKSESETTIAKLEKIFSKEEELINTANDFGYTFLLRAVYAKNEKLLDYLLAKDKINPNTFDKDGFTPLHWTIDLDWKIGFTKLLNHPQIDPQIQTHNNKQETPLALANSMGRAEMSSLLEDLLEEKIYFKKSLSNK